MSTMKFATLHGGLIVRKGHAAPTLSHHDAMVRAAPVKAGAPAGHGRSAAGEDADPPVRERDKPSMPRHTQPPRRRDRPRVSLRLTLMQQLRLKAAAHIYCCSQQRVLSDALNAHLAWLSVDPQEDLQDGSTTGTSCAEPGTAPAAGNRPAPTPSAV